MRRPAMIPASLLRVRCFINARGRHKVKPWATAGETLDALHATLLGRRNDDGFWEGLEDLLERLASDARGRASSLGSAVANEVLDTVTHRELLAEIRERLDGRKRGCGSYGRLLSSLSAPAMGLLVVLGAVVTLGCSSTELLHGGMDAEAETAPDPVDPAPEPECWSEGYTLEQIIEEAVGDPEARAAYLECLPLLHESWATGLREYFDCMDHWDVRAHLECLINPWGDSFCDDPEESGVFDLETFLDNCGGAPIYIGVRFE